MKDFVQTLITIAVSSGITLFAVWLTNKGNKQNLQIDFELRQKERKSITMQEKQEELFIESKAYFNSLISFYWPSMLTMQNKINFNETSECITKQVNENMKTVNANRVFMLIGLYFPELKSHFTEIISVRDELNKINGMFKKDYESGIHSGNVYIDDFVLKHQRLIKLTGDFEDHLLKISVSV